MLDSATNDEKNRADLRKINYQVISNPPLSEVLKFPNIVQLFQNKSNLLIQYMAKHVHELLSIAISSTISPESLDPLVALYILCTTNYSNPILEIILDDSTFTREVSVTIHSSDANEELISRLATLTFAAFRTFPSKAINSCWFLSSFLPYVKNTNVCSLLLKLCDYNPLSEQTKDISKWLKKYGFAEDVISELSKINYNRKITDEEKYTDPEVYKLISLYNIIIHCTNNPILADSFKVDSMVIALNQTFLSQPPFLTGKRYETIKSILSDSNSNLIKPFVANAVSLLYTPHLNPMQNVVESINFISHIAKISSNVSEYLKGTQIFQVLLRYVIQFPNSTFLQIAFNDFVIMSLKNPVLCKFAFDQYLQLFIAEARLRSNGACSLTSSFLNILLFIQSNRKKDELLSKCLKKTACRKEYLTFEKEYLKKYKKILKKDYGGKIETQDNISVVFHNVPNAD